MDMRGRISASPANRFDQPELSRNLLNRCNGENCGEVRSNAPQDLGMHSQKTKEAAKKGGVEAIGRDSVGF